MGIKLSFAFALIGLLSLALSCGPSEVVLEDDDIYCASNWDEEEIQEFPVRRDFCLNSAGQIKYFKQNYGDFDAYGRLEFGSSITQEEFETIRGFEAEHIRFVWVMNNSMIDDLSVFDDVGEVGGWRFKGATGFTDLSTLPVHGNMMDLSIIETTNLRSVELPLGADFTREDSPYFGVSDPAGVLIMNNEALRSVSGFNGVVSAEQVKIEANSELVSVSGFGALEDVYNLWLIDNANLESVSGFGSLLSVGQLAVSFNSSLDAFPTIQETLEEFTRNCSFIENKELDSCLALAICTSSEEPLSEDDYAVKGNDDSQPCD